jgi:hypothetical protein
MSGRAYSRSVTPSGEFQEHTDFLRWELLPDERVGAPLRTSRRWPRWLAAAVLAMAGGGWAMIDDKPATLEWLSAEASSVVAFTKSMIGVGEPEPVSQASPPLQLSALQLLDSAWLSVATGALPRRDVAENEVAAPVVVPQVANKDVVETSATQTQTEGTAAQPEKPAPLPPLPPLTDPLQKKAEAVGLHPELSRAVLESLTPTDFRNAAIAIKKAIAETPEDGALVWPAKPKRGLARFRVHFVPGISPACRRYVVAVAKSGWLTTALPMERCGVKPRMARSHRAPDSTHRGSAHR